jgi:hypothetical protein
MYLLLSDAIANDFHWVVDTSNWTGNSLLLLSPKIHYSFRKSPHWPLSRAILIQFTSSYPISLKTILILSSHIHLRSKSRLISEFCICSWSLACVLYVPPRRFQCSLFNHADYIIQMLYTVCETYYYVILYNTLLFTKVQIYSFSTLVLNPPPPIQFRWWSSVLCRVVL